VAVLGHVRAGDVSRRLLILALALAATALAGGASLAAVSAGTVTVNVTITGEFKGKIAGVHPEDAKDMLPAKNACTRFTKPNFPVPGRPLAYNVSFGNPDVIHFRKGIFFAFYYDPRKTGQPQKLYNAKPGGASLLAVAAKYKGFGLAGEGWAGTVTLNRDLRSGSFLLTAARGIIGNEKVTLSGTWRCSVTYVRAT
jgi:hypothetical protein